jgi:uncharacterized membrane protein YkvA (DUF1232 family)
MNETTDTMDDDFDFEESMRDSSAAAGEVSPDRAQRFYDRLRTRIHAFLENKGSVAGRAGEFLLLVPDMFMLLWRLVNDSRVDGKAKVLLGSGIAYYLFPFDFMPEAIMGPMGFMDDLVFGVYMLNRMLRDTDPEILRQHWSGDSDLLETINKVLGTAESLVGSNMLTRIKKMI